MNQCSWVVGLKELPTGERLPEKHPRGIDVAEAADFSPAEVLGRHVGERALGLVAAAGLQVPVGRRQPKVEDPRHAVFTDEHVVGRNVTMHDAEGPATRVSGLVCRVKAVQNPGDNGARNLRRDPLAPLAQRPDHPRKRLARDVLHDEKDLVIRRDDVDRRHDVLVTDARDEACLAEKHANPLGILRKLRVKLLDRHCA